MRIDPSALLLLSVSLVAIGCVAQAPTGRPQDLQAQLDEDWKYWMSEYPEVATSIGYPGQDARWTDYSQTSIERRNDYLR